jgi:peptidoglycan hydrolase-like protein with peptidoglycan-binding domain
MMTGDDIKTLQTYLNNKGYDCGLVDGIFGNKTKQAVIKFQIANGLKGDGIVGPLTRAMMK